VEQHLGIAVGPELTAVGLQSIPELAIVVNLAVEHDLERAVGAAHRLLSGLQIDDGEPPVRQTDARIRPYTRIIRTSMHECVVHGREHISIDGMMPVGEENASDATHGQRDGATLNSRRNMKTFSPF